jgi:alginate O-acetyltransferase complex protein AlgI
MSYSIDIYRGISKPQKNIIDFGTYVTLFPQLIAGPIVTYNQIELELKDRKKDLDNGLALFLLGLAKKVILANNIGILWETLYNTPTHTIVGNWLAIICFGFQIYFDFSGYSDMAIGLGRMLGFHFPKNFNYPYLSKSITEFWRRWHISLGTWFRDYVYIPLGGNKKGIKRQIINISIVWILTGFWHGANYNFILWGIYFGIILILEKLFLLKILKKIPIWLQHIYALFLIFFGWTFFAIEDFSKLIDYIKGMFVSNIFVDNNVIEIMWNNKIMLLLCIICSFPLLRNIIFKSKFKNIILFVLLLISLTFLLSSSYNPFLYFRF